MAGVDEPPARVHRREEAGRHGQQAASTNWTITQTNRFQAAVSQRSIGDGRRSGTTDFTLFTFWFRKYPFQDPEEYRKRSPVTYIDRVTTPLMLIEGESDLRTLTDAGGGVMFRASRPCTPAVMVLFRRDP
jgi:dipeptidyl aminopeptidase/acylaminoacyl peptidase